ncbi:TonB-dependent receptor [Hymenobacter puniceus]|uniref:TonB-dependent receptor n=1 Tax=Hymenobacter sp. BT190 TaxID=2763505 RepID=UPI0016518A3B|nr:carboxypeptidase-like regulatory domain-containing protein [Hymenobacter sp. BT190]MBC6700575.1 carboxypeptidase-like regulatory domain-containing protein [Hymenobacter sp. BT190]
MSGIVQTDSGEPLPGATVFVKGTFIGSSTDREGRFQLRADFSEPPVVLSVSFVGYETREVSLPQPDNAVQVTLKINSTLTSEVIASASRVQEGILQAPVTVEKLNTQQVERIPTADLQVGLSQYKGIDVNSSSLLMNSLSTRGFNSAKSERLIQLTDYFDTQSPSLNVNAGNLTGLPELDVESIEIIHGPASALYGANAFNGVLLLNSKDPFVTEGLSVRLRGGQRSLLEGQLRYAQKLGEKFAFKIVGSYLTADDWLASNYSATSTVIEARNNPENSTLGYDAVNRYGDVRNTFTANQPLPGGVSPELVGKTVFMPGFTEQTLIGDDNKAKSLKVHPTLSYLLTSSIKLTAGFNYSRGTASYQSSSRYRFKDFGTNQFHGEIKSARWFVRGQSVQDFGGNSYDMNFLGSFLQAAPVADGSTTRNADVYFGTYNGAYKQARNAGATPEQAQALAQTQANATQLDPNGARFQQLRSQIISDATPGRGARLNPSSLLNEGNAQYNLPLAENTDLIVGGAYRKFRLGSNGNLFADDNARIQNNELGGYAQLTQKLLDERLKLAVAGRVDAFKNFDAAFSPRASVVYSAGASKQHNFRASYSRAFRSPTQLDQYIRLDVGQVLILGNVDNGFQGYTTAAANQATIVAAQSNPAVLTPFEYSAAALKLERLSTYEAGYKGTLGEKLALDVNYYQSYYNDFIGAQRFVGNRDGSRPTPAQLATALQTPQPFQGATSPTRILQVWTNARQEVRTHGAALGASYSVAQPLTLTANYSLNVLDKSNLPDNFQSFFNTPKHKYNVGANGLVNSRLSYALNYRWAQGHLYELPFAVGELADYSSVDAYVGYAIPQFFTTVQAGGSNLLDATNTQVYGGPNIGRLVFVGLQVDIK